MHLLVNGLVVSTESDMNPVDNVAQKFDEWWINLRGSSTDGRGIRKAQRIWGSTVWDRQTAQVVAMIPARGGSKGILKKNIKKLNNLPLIRYTVEAALKSEGINRVIVSTDSGEIAAEAVKLGAEVPFLRPAELATDDSPTIDSVWHFLDMVPNASTIVLLQPTSPFRSSADIESCLGVHFSSGCKSVVSVCESSKHPAWMYSLRFDGTLCKFSEIDASRRQDLQKVYCLNGAIYIASAAQLRSERTFITSSTLGYAMPRERSLDLDTPLDWEYAEFMLSRRNP